MADISARDNLARPAPVHRLDIRKAFDGLQRKEKQYAHHMSRAAWHGARIIMRQTSPESVEIFDLLLELHVSCDGNWRQLAHRTKVSDQEITNFLDYAAAFLSNVGNYYGSGDQKFIPDMSQETLQNLASITPKAAALCNRVATAIFAVPPYGLGFPSDKLQSAYYPGEQTMTAEHIRAVSQILEKSGVYPENTRIRQVEDDDRYVFEVLQASSETSASRREFSIPDSKNIIRLVAGDHYEELTRICDSLREASKFASNEIQVKFLSQYAESFRTGNLEAYRDSQRTWVKDTNPRVENIFGFVEPYRDPHGIRAEFEGLVAISDPEESKALMNLVENSAKFIRRLPWAEGATENDGKGLFEKALFEPPDFTSIHSLAYCSSIIFPGINLPNYNDIRQDSGFKNVIVANRMSTESSTAEISPYVDPVDAQDFHKHKYPAYYWWVVLHELLGHGTGKMMIEDSNGDFNFDKTKPPINPLTGSPITSWYRPGQSWTGQFADIATTVDECRAELVGAYLMDDVELLSLFGFNESSESTPEDLTYNTYMQLGIDGLRGLQNFNTDSQKWGQAHSRAHFATLKCLLRDGKGFMKVKFDPADQRLTVRVDRSRIVSDGKPALGKMLLNLHMFRCTADVKACREYYEDLSSVDGVYLQWREVVIAQSPPKWTFVHANTFLKKGEVVLKEYPASKEGILQSWAEREV